MLYGYNSIPKVELHVEIKHLSKGSKTAQRHIPIENLSFIKEKLVTKEK